MWKMLIQHVNHNVIDGRRQPPSHLLYCHCLLSQSYMLPVATSGLSSTMHSQRRRLEKIQRGLSPEDTSAVAGVVGAVIGMGAGFLLKGSLSGESEAAPTAAPESEAPGSLGSVGMAPDGNHQFRGFEPQPRESRSGRKLNSIDLEGLKGVS